MSSAARTEDQHQTRRAAGDDAATLLARFNIRVLFHFTDTRNLISIKTAQGLLSRRELNRRGISPPACGGNEWSQKADERVGLDAYVHLCLVGDHPMEFVARRDGRILKTRWIKVDPQVIFEEGVRLTAHVSNKSGVSLLTIPEALEALDLSVLYDRMDWSNPEIRARRRAAKKYEVLVPGQVPIRFIQGL
jgi:hypothetical protein